MIKFNKFFFNNGIFYSYANSNYINKKKRNIYKKKYKDSIESGESDVMFNNNIDKTRKKVSLNAAGDDDCDMEHNETENYDHYDTEENDLEDYNVYINDDEYIEDNKYTVKKCKNCDQYLEIISAAQRKISMQDTEYKDLLKQYSEEKEIRGELEGMLENNKLVQKELNNNLKAAKRNNASIKNQLNNSNQDKLLLRNQHNNLSQQINRMYDDMNMLEKKIKDLKSQNKKNRMEHDSEREKLHNILKEKDKMYNNNKQVIKELRHQLGLKDMNIKSIQSEKESLQGELSNMIEQNSQTLIQMQNDFHDKTKSDQKKIAKIVANLEDSYSEIAKLNSLNSKLDNRNTELKQINKKLLEDLEKQNKKIKKKNKKNKSNNADFQENASKEDPLDKFFNKGGNNNDQIS